MDNLTEFAREELKRAGLFKQGDDSLYDGMIGEAVLELIETFSKQGHSGMSAPIVLHIFKTLASWKPLSPISSDPTEWMEVGTNVGRGKGHGVWQSRRDASCFSEDGGKTWYDIDHPTKWLRIKRFFYSLRRFLEISNKPRPVTVDERIIKIDPLSDSAPLPPPQPPQKNNC